MKSLRWRVFLFGFIPSVALIGLIWLSNGWFLIGDLLLIVSNPLAILILLICQDLADWGRHGWTIESGILLVESAFWWYVVAGIVDAIKRRRLRTA
jgi:hypothetical protein